MRPSIDRMKPPIHSITFGTEIVAPATQSCVGVWHLKTDKLINLTYSSIGAIVTHAIVSLDGMKRMSKNRTI